MQILSPHADTDAPASPPSAVSSHPTASVLLYGFQIPPAAFKNNNGNNTHVPSLLKQVKMAKKNTVEN